MLSTNKLKQKVNTKESANGSMTMIFVIIGAFIFIITAYVCLTRAMLMSHQHDVDDALADSVLAACVGDREHYFQTRESDDEDVSAEIRFLDMNACANNFTSCLYSDVHNSGAEFFKNLKIEELTFYEVAGDDITVTSFSAGEGGAFSSNTWHGTKGNVSTSAGATVERTSVYARISFDVQAYFVFDITKNVSRELYSTIKIEDYAVKPGLYDLNW